MRIHFVHFGQANLHLKVCKRALEANLPVPAGLYIPAMATRNAYCRAFAYNGYDELRRLYISRQEPSGALQSNTELHDAIVRGFLLALEVVRERGVPIPGDSSAYATMLAKIAWDEIERRRPCSSIVPINARR